MAHRLATIQRQVGCVNALGHWGDKNRGNKNINMPATNMKVGGVFFSKTNFSRFCFLKSPPETPPTTKPCHRSWRAMRPSVVECCRPWASLARRMRSLRSVCRTLNLRAVQQEIAGFGGWGQFFFFKFLFVGGFVFGCLCYLGV